ncbi:glycoside hydrolase family 3 C-terminal domain-containing protein [bacterium]|nr:glycoside hydrolase family 3 C-terminal domain-containing protein [bacterium]
MTLEEKFRQLFMIPGDPLRSGHDYGKGIFGLQVSTRGSADHAAGQLLEYGAGGSARAAAERINAIQRYFREETRLGIPIIVFDEALHGLVREGATAFPQAIGLAATWDKDLMRRVAGAIALEVRSRGIRQILSPVVNIARDVRWGRVEETYGEDPRLTAEMAIAFVSEFETLGVITTPKHFVANVGDGGRDSYPIHFSERLLEEIYFPAFRACIQEGGSRSVMTSYNSLDGSPCTASDRLLNRILKDAWGFRGFVISDAGATGGANVLHFTARDYTESSANALNNGLDVIFQTSLDHLPLFYPAAEQGLIPETVIDRAVARVLTAKVDLGLFDQPYVDPEEAAAVNGCEAHRELARQAARESIILLKNEPTVLPLLKKIRSIAVIGRDAAEARPGGYSGPGVERVSILEGIKARAGGAVRVDYEEGCGRETIGYVSVPAAQLSHLKDGRRMQGLLGAYYRNRDWAGDPVLVRSDPRVQFGWTLYSPDPVKLDYDWYSVRWTGQITAPESGLYRIGLEGNDGWRLWIDGACILDNLQKQTVRRVTAEYRFERGRRYDIRIDFYETTGNVRLDLVWNMGVHDTVDAAITAAVKSARESDAAIIVAGIEEGEFRDRALLGLPGRQEEMIRRVAATGTPVVVVLVGGSAVTMSGWIDAADGIIDVWYPGDRGGYAVADVLFGDYNPAGRLPITFPVHEGQLPLYYNHKPAGRGDDYLNLTGHPLFPFGFGLSYTTFTYSDLVCERKQVQAGEPVRLTFRLANSGSREGDEVVQLYIRDLYASVARPVMELIDFQRIHLRAGEMREVGFEIPAERLSMLDKDLKRVIEPGTFRVMVGASSRDIRLRDSIEVVIQ